MKFDLLNRQHRIEIQTPVIGLVVIRNFGSQLTNNFPTITNETIQTIIEEFRDFYSNKYKVDPDYSFLRSFFSHIYLIISLIDSNEFLTESEKTTYADIFRSQISQEELIIIFYHCLYNYDHKNLETLVKKYFLLQSLYENKINHMFRQYLIEHYKALYVEKFSFCYVFNKKF